MIDGDHLPTLSAARVRLRWLEPSDARAVFDIFSDPEVMRYWSFPAYTELAQAEKLIEEIHDLFREKTLFQWGVALADTNTVIGTTTLASVDAENRRAEIGFALARAHQGQGLMREAVNRLLAYAFDELKLRRIEADVDPLNEPSLRLLERVGFVREGLLRERWEVGGQLQDTVFLGLLAREWPRP